MWLIMVWQTPIITPNVSSEEEVCPNCWKPEDIVEVCKHCRYEYEDDSDISFWDVIIMAVVLFLVIAAIFMFFIPLLNWLSDEHITLVKSYADMFKYVGNLFKRIF